MPETFPLMPVTAGGPAAPLETPTTQASQHPQSEGGIGDVFGAAYRSSPVVTGMMRGYGDLAYGDQTVPQDKASEIVKAQGLDPAFIPKDGIGYGALQEEIQRQGEIKLRQLYMQRSGGPGLGSTIVGTVGAGLADPSSVVLGPAAGAIGNLARGGLALRAAVGATEGAAYQFGMSAGQSYMTGHDDDILSWQTLHDTTFAALLGATIHGAVGPRAKITSDQAIDNVLQSEGGKTVDTGGKTNFGISQNAHPEVDIDNLTIGDARKIYKEQYWDKIDGDNLPAPLQMTALDAAVNQGVEKTSAWLKEADGDPVKFNALRRADYEKLATENPDKYGKYLNGWLNRLNRVSLQSVQPFFPRAAGDTSSVLGRDMQDVMDRSQWAPGATSRVESGLEVPRPELETPATQEAAQGEMLGQLGRMQLPEIEQRGPMSPVEMGTILRRAQARGMDVGPREQMVMGQEALQRFANENVSDMRPTSVAPGNAADFQAKQAAVPQPILDQMKAQDARIAATPLTAGSPAEAMAESTANIRNSLPEEQHQAFDEAIKTAENEPEEGTRMLPDELDKAVNAAIRCGVLKGVQYGGD